MENGENIIYYCKFDTQGKSFDELSDVSKEAFEALKYAVEMTSAFNENKDKAETLKFLHVCLGFAVLECCEISVNSDLCINLIADEFKLSESSNLLFAHICSLARTVKIKAESQKCVVSIE